MNDTSFMWPMGDQQAFMNKETLYRSLDLLLLNLVVYYTHDTVFKDFKDDYTRLYWVKNAIMDEEEDIDLQSVIKTLTSEKQFSDKEELLKFLQDFRDDLVTQYDFLDHEEGKLLKEDYKLLYRLYKAIRNDAQAGAPASDTADNNKGELEELITKHWTNYLDSKKVEAFEQFKKTLRIYEKLLKQGQARL